MDVAIGEYAPGRAIVVDKATYQIGGFYYPGSERRSGKLLSPARAFVDDENYSKRVVSCNECGWFGLQEDDVKQCPFCGNPVLGETIPMLRPWGFAPKNGKAISEAQLQEEFSYVQQPLYSTLPDSETMVSVSECCNMRIASRTNQRIIMMNKGVSEKGFTVCCDCGAAVPGDSSDALDKVERPYVSKYIRSKCRHTSTKNVNLGYDFITDMLVLEIHLDPNLIETDRADNLWLNRAGQSLSEAIRLVVSRVLDIEFTELVTGYRVRKVDNDAFMDIYIYDSLSSGAGYAVGVASVIDEVIAKTSELLEKCTCENACYNCLKHYRNQNVHGMLDRFAALDLLRWAESGTRSAMQSAANQCHMIGSLEAIFKESNIEILCDDSGMAVKRGKTFKRLKVYPAMWKRPEEQNTIFVSDACIKYAKPYAVKQIIEGI